MMKISPRACRHCGSPAKMNPCWWRFKHPNPNYDPPCCEDEYVDFQRTSDRHWSCWFWSIIAIVLMGCMVGLYYG